jgi:hypothetical protein
MILIIGIAFGHKRRGQLLGSVVMLGLLVAVAVSLFAVIVTVRVGVPMPRVEVPEGSTVIGRNYMPPAPTLPNGDSAPSGEKPPGEKPPVEAAGPDWLKKHGQFNGKEYEIAVKSGLYVTIPECQHALEAAEQQAVHEYLDSYLGEGAADLVNLDARYVRDNLQKKQYTEQVDASIGVMQQMHALLVFDDQARSDFQDRWRQALVTQRLWYVGGAAAAVLAAVASAFGYLVTSSRVVQREAVPQ